VFGHARQVYFLLGCSHLEGNPQIAGIDRLRELDTCRGKDAIATVDLRKLRLITDEQKTQIRSILSDERTQMQQVMQDQSVARQDKRSKMQDIHQSATEKINGLLNDEQKKKYADYEQKRREQMQQRRRGEMEPPSE
jgi:hypothetical protein